MVLECNGLPAFWHSSPCFARLCRFSSTDTAPRFGASPGSRRLELKNEPLSIRKAVRRQIDVPLKEAPPAGSQLRTKGIKQLYRDSAIFALNATTHVINSITLVREGQRES